MIYRLFTGNHIDLDKIVDVSAPEMVFDTFPSSMGVHVQFEITFQLMDDTKVYRVLPECEEVLHERLLCHGVAYLDQRTIEDQNVVPDIMVRTQEGMDRLIAVWKEYKNFKSK